MLTRFQAMDAPTPRKSNRLLISFAAWFSALSASWRSILLTMSKLDSLGMTIRLDGYGANRHTGHSGSRRGRRRDPGDGAGTSASQPVALSAILLSAASQGGAWQVPRVAKGSGLSNRRLSLRWFEPNTCHYMRRRPARYEFPAMRVVSSLSQCVSPCRADGVKITGDEGARAFRSLFSGAHKRRAERSRPRRFRLSLSRTEGGVSSSRPELSAAPTIWFVNGSRILLVEDDEDIGTELVQALTSYGHYARLARAAAKRCPPRQRRGRTWYCLTSGCRTSTAWRSAVAFAPWRRMGSS